MFLNGEWQPPEPKAGVAAKAEMIDRQIGELTLQWEQARDNVDLALRLARLWEERFEWKGDAESFNGAFYFYHHINVILNGSDSSIVRKLKDFELKQLDLHIKPLEAWVAVWGSGDYANAVMAGQQLADMKKAKTELLATQEMLQVLFGGKGAEPRIQLPH